MSTSSVRCVAEVASTELGQLKKTLRHGLGRDPDFRVMHRPRGPMNWPDFSIGSISLPSSSSEEGV